jgi:hypothetical protein
MFQSMGMYNSWNTFITKSVNFKVKQCFNKVFKKLKNESWNYQQSDENNSLLISKFCNKLSKIFDQMISKKLENGQFKLKIVDLKLNKKIQIKIFPKMNKF